jgi:hypothetical protein
MSILTPDEVRARNVELPTDAAAAQDIIDENEAWLEARIGQLVGERTEQFFVGWGIERGPLYLARTTSSVVIVDGGITLVPIDDYRIIEKGSALLRTDTTAFAPYWIGPHVLVTYEPNDEQRVRRVLIGLVATETDVSTGYQSEQIGSYSYNLGTPGGREQYRASLASSLIPERPPTQSVHLGVPYYDNWRTVYELT